MVGSDGADYVQRFKELGIETRHVGQLQNTHTAQCMIMTGIRDNNQITAFHPGAMMQAHENQITPDMGSRGQGRYRRLRWASGHDLTMPPSSKEQAFRLYSIQARVCPCSMVMELKAFIDQAELGWL